jgi:hypothetical protein
MKTMLGRVTAFPGTGFGAAAVATPPEAIAKTAAMATSRD